MTRRSTAIVATAAGTVMALMAAAPVAFAVEEPVASTIPGSTTTTSSIPADTSTSTTKPSTTTAPTTTTTTTTTVPGELELPPEVTIPPELADDPRAPVLFNPGDGDGGEVPYFQGVFDPGTNEILEARVAELRDSIAARIVILNELNARIDAQQLVVLALLDELDSLDAATRDNVELAAAAEEELRDHTVEAFITGSIDDQMSLVRSGDPVQIGVARELLGSIVDSDEEVVERHRSAQAALDEDAAALSSELTEARKERTRLVEQFKAALADTVAESKALEAFEAGSQVYVEGFVFPVQGEVEFIDSWGYPRMTGTPSSHWHQGTDIFAPMGTPLVASESGVIQRLGQASLGGNKLWVKGDTGNEYYYAHLVSFAPGMADGTRVTAGDVVGYVGDTGNARGTPPHLHFEVHPGGGDAVNPYPLLKATYGSKAMVKVVPTPPPTTTTTTTAPPALPVDPAAAGPVPAAPAPAPAVAPGG